MRALAVLSLVFATACASPQKPTCTPEALKSLRTLYEAAASDVISSGACDKVQRVEDCAAYAAIEKHFAVAMKGMCR